MTTHGRLLSVRLIDGNDGTDGVVFYIHDNQYGGTFNCPITSVTLDGKTCLDLGQLGLYLGQADHNATVTGIPDSSMHGNQEIPVTSVSLTIIRS